MNALLTAFQGTSSKKLVEIISNFDILVLENNKEKLENQLYKNLDKTDYDYVFSFGQRPHIKDKIHIESTAKRGDIAIKTEFAIDRFVAGCNKSNLVTEISHNAGTSYCNYIYYSGMEYIISHDIDTKMVFIHVPFEKNISDFELFIHQVSNCINDFLGENND